MRDLVGNKFGTPNPIPFRDSEFGLTVDIKLFGEYVMKVTDPIKFYTSLGGSVEDDYVIDEKLTSQFSSDFMQALQPALFQVAMQKVSYDMLPGAVKQISEAVKSELDTTWGENGLNVARVSISGVTPTEETAEAIKEAQKDRLYAMNPDMKGSRANRAASEAMVDAANNANGAMAGFMGMGMMNQGGAMFGANISEQSQSNTVMGGMNVAGYDASGIMQQPKEAVQEEVTEEASITKDVEEEPSIEADTPQGKFCTNCGEAVTGKFCQNCGTKVE